MVRLERGSLYPDLMKLFGRRKRQQRAIPSYSNESVIERIQQDASVDRDTARTSYQRAYQQRAASGSPIDSTVWAAPAGAGLFVGASEDDDDDGDGAAWAGSGGGTIPSGESDSSGGSGDSGGGSSCGGGGG